MGARPPQPAHRLLPHLLQPSRLLPLARLVLESVSGTSFRCPTWQNVAWAFSLGAAAGLGAAEAPPGSGATGPMTPSTS